jgi:hypothetical protein
MFSVNRVNSVDERVITLYASHSVSRKRQDAPNAKLKMRQTMRQTLAKSVSMSCRLGVRKIGFALISAKIGTR